MKRLVLLLISVNIVLTPAFAEKISHSHAQQIAENFFRMNGKNPVLQLENVPSMTKSLNEEPLYYVFNNVNGSGGFVVVSGDDSSRQILAYSLTGYFDSTNMPDNMAFWMKNIEESIRSGRKASHTSSSSGSSVYEKVLQTATWSQLEPYNNMCPIVRGSRSVTGCVATATAIVLRYHKWPDAGAGILPDYNNVLGDNGNIQPGHALGHSYDWEHMPLNLTRNSSEQEIKAVSQLLFDLGVMNETQYGPSGSASFFYPSGLVRYMKYDPYMVCLSRGELGDRKYSDSKWFSIIEQEIDANRPIIYGGIVDGVGGHEFVVDGYNSDGYIHINWGWGPDNLGFYALDNMTFNQGQEMYIGIKPYRDIIPEGLTICCDRFDCYNSVFFGEPCRQFQISVHEKFFRQGFDCTVALWRVRKNGELKQQMAYFDFSGSRPYLSYGTVYGFENDLFGEYAMLLYHMAGESQWKPLEFVGSYNVIEKIPLFDKKELEKRTSVKYNKQTGNIEVFSDEYAAFDLLDDSGRTISNLLKTEKGKAIVSIDKFPSFCCTIRVSLNGQSIDLLIKGGGEAVDQNGTENIRKGESIEW